MKQSKTLPENAMRSRRRLQQLVRPRTIELTDAVRQEKNPPAFMVFCHNDTEHDYMFFGEEREARDYAMEQEEKAEMPEDSWPIYALWAAEWPNAKLSDSASTTNDSK